MCGIAGLLEAGNSHPAEELEARATAMARTLTHRGPDDAGTWTDPRFGVALGFRRLSIVDLSSTGHQPMTSRDGRYVLVFNGELYNHRALRVELEAAGVTFRGRSDTEVLLEAISTWGLERALVRANAMFALACWDRHDHTLGLARDRFGEKPLYYGWIGRTFLFGSELKALRAHPSFSPSIDRDALALYFRYAYVPAPRSIYEGIAKLPPATFLRVDPSRPGHTPEPVPYWSPIEAATDLLTVDRTLTGPSAADAVEEALRESIALRMVADVPVGAFLSGGTDSSLVVALMQAQSSRPVRTFTIGFDHTGYNEAVRARAVAEHLGTEHTELYVSAQEAQATIPRLPTIYDEPFGDSSQMPTLLVAELARREVTVALSGDGGDELFGGYTRYAAVERLRRSIRLPHWARHVVARMVTSQPPQRLDRWVRAASRVTPGRDAPAQPGDKLHKLAHALDIRDPAHVYRSLVECWSQPPVLGTDEPRAGLETGLGTGALAGRVRDAERAMLIDTLTYLPDDLLTKVDRASMAVGLEARVPMLDPTVFTTAWQLPFDAKMGGHAGKRVLTDVLGRYLPRPLVGGPKIGFGVPFGAWLRGPLRSWADAQLDVDRLRNEGYLDAVVVRRTWEEHCTGRRDHRHKLWAALMFQAWLEADG